MEDIKILKTCNSCKAFLTLMASCRISEDKNEGTFLVERCLCCGNHPVTEIARLFDSEDGEE